MTEPASFSFVRFRCTHCSREVMAPAGQAGQEIGCPHCRAVLMVPAAGGDAAAPAVEASDQPAGAPPETPAAAPVGPTLLSGEGPTILAGPEGATPPSDEPPVPQTADVIQVEQLEVGAPALQAAEAPPERAPRPARALPRRYARPARARDKRVVHALVGAAGLAALVVIGLTWAHLSRQAAIQAAHKALLGQQQATREAFEEGDLAEAGKLADALPKGRQELEKLGGKLSVAEAKALDELAGEVKTYRQRLADLEGLAAALDKDPSGVKNQLLDQRALCEAAGPRARLLLERIAVLVRAAEELETQRRVEALRREVEEAEQTYLSGTVEAALEQAGQVRTAMAADTRLHSDDLQKRLDQLRSYGEQLAAVRRIRAGAGADFNGAQKKLTDLAAKLSAGRPEHRPLLAEIEKLRAELREEERRQVRLTQEDLQRLTRTAELLARREPALEVGPGAPATGIPLRYESQSLRLIGLDRQQRDGRLLMDTGGLRFRVGERLAREQPAVCFRMLQALADGLRRAAAPGPRVWDVLADMPYPTASSAEENGTLVVSAGKLYTAEVFAPPAEEKAAPQQLAAAAEALAKAIEQDPGTPPDYRPALVTLVRGAYKELQVYDYLPGSFCRAVLADGYIEKNVPGAGVRLREQLDGYRQAYAAFTRPAYQFKARDDSGDELSRAVDCEDRAVVWSYDKTADRTCFGIKHPVAERRRLYVVYEFAGRQEQFPAGRQPLAVKMVHPVAGVMAAYDPASGKLEADAKRWANGAAWSVVGDPPAWMGEPEWAFPPHVLLVDLAGRTQGLVTPAGKVDFPHFAALADKAQRRAAQDKYLDELARVLNSTGLLHLYFLYFHQYVLDSPIETASGLLGSRAHSGDIHQDAYQSLDRELGGRYVGDCDDLAEMYMDLTRRQGKLSYVMSLPHHAACGWVEKTGDGYVLQFLDTGPPRIFEGDDLEKLVEIGSRSYDLEKTMRFDPKSVPFLFRFAGEPTRTPYWLSCRMFYDRPYAEIMERVQSYWHFHFYALGIQTMEEMIAKGDRVPENCVELAGLYGSVREVRKSVQWTQEALKQLGEQDVLSRLSEKFRVGIMFRQDKDEAGAYQAIRDSVEELKQLSGSPDWLRYVSQRMDFAGLLNTIERPFEAWELIRPDALRFLQAGQMRLEQGGLLTQLYYKMQEAARKPGSSLSDAEKRGVAEIERGLTFFYGRLCFLKEDDFNDNLRDYAYLGRFYGAKYGPPKLLDELLKDSPYPAQERDHVQRRGGEEEDWKWIRLSPLSYALAIGETVDPDDPPEKWRRDEAAKLAEAMQRAAGKARAFGSLASTEFVLLDTRLLHGFLTRNWGEVEDVLKEVQRREFARLTATIAETFGQSARFISPQDFEAQFRLFAKYANTRAPYFSVVYEAYRMECYDHARAAAGVAVQRWPDDENMKREAKYLEDLIRSRLKEKQEKKGIKDQGSGIRGQGSAVVVVQFTIRNPQSAIVRAVQSSMAVPVPSPL